jgi:hypothetical protein
MIEKLEKAKDKKESDGHKFQDPESGQFIEKDSSLYACDISHGGSAWKLFDKSGKKIGTVSKNGIWLRN